MSRPMTLSAGAKAHARLKDLLKREDERRHNIILACNELYKERMRRRATPALIWLDDHDRDMARFVVSTRLTYEAACAVQFEERTAALRKEIYNGTV